MEIENKLKEMGLRLPRIATPVANYIHWVRDGNILYLAGAVGMMDGKLEYVGKVGKELTIEEGYQSARLCGLNHLASIKDALGDLDLVDKFIRLVGYVNSAPGFTEPFKVVNGESDLIVELYGEERGKHARAAICVSDLGLDSPVETILTVRVKG
ncbi:MAG: RidA family protein [Nitrospinota bacterium]